MKLDLRIVFTLTLLAAEMTSAVTLNVTSIADSGPGTLRDVLSSAVDGDTINITRIHGTIQLTSGELLVGKSVVIVGPGPAKLAVDGGTSRVFHISPNMVVDITGLTITNGMASPDGPYPYYLGGGVYNDHAMLSLNNCIVIDSIAGSGAGIANDGSSGSAVLKLTNCLVTGNAVQLESSSGGGIVNLGKNGEATAIIVNSTVSDNDAGFSGGGIFNNGFDGFAILALDHSTISNNIGWWSGGGVYNAGWDGTASIALQDSTVTENQSLSGAGIYNAGYSGTASLTITNCAIVDNQCLFYGTGGGLYNGISGGSAMITLANSTISENTAKTGGGIFNGNDSDKVPGFSPGGGFLEILNCTFSDNSAETIYDGNCLSCPTIEIGSTILNASRSGSTIGFSCSVGSDAFTSLGYNLSSDGGDGVLTVRTDLVNAKPRLGPLRDNGGPTFTQALLSASPAIDRGKNFSHSTFDQRGPRFFRTVDLRYVPNAPGGDGTDIGAFEVRATSPPWGWR